MSAAQGDGHRLGVEFSTFGAGVGVVLGEEERGLFLPGGLEAICLYSGHVDIGDVLFGGQLFQLGVVAHVALDLGFAVGAVLPDIADGQREQDGRRLFRAGVGDVFTDIPAVGVDGFGVAVGEGDVFGLVAQTLEGAAGLGAVEVSTIVVAHLEEHEIAGLHLGENAVPRALVDEGAAAASGAGAVGHVDARGVEVVGEVV